ncbi:MAG: DUF5076 domain-containing protein [Sphingomonas sp.]|nr:DUF5076 domain-containing protein [Sphingomonas sp.]
MSDNKPIPIDLTPYAQNLTGAREFLRLWATEAGPVFCFINPVPIGADPMGFGLAIVDAIGHAAKAYAKAVNISESDALARIWEGVDAERGNSTDSPIEFVPRKEAN